MININEYDKLMVEYIKLLLTLEQDELWKIKIPKKVHFLHNRLIKFASVIKNKADCYSKNRRRRVKCYHDLEKIKYTKLRNLDIVSINYSEICNITYLKKRNHGGSTRRYGDNVYLHFKVLNCFNGYDNKTLTINTIPDNDNMLLGVEFHNTIKNVLDIYPYKNKLLLVPSLVFLYPKNIGISEKNILPIR